MAAVTCGHCEQCLCAVCDIKLHLKGTRKLHERKKIEVVLFLEEIDKTIDLGPVYKLYEENLVCRHKIVLLLCWKGFLSNVATFEFTCIICTGVDAVVALWLRT